MIHELVFHNDRVLRLEQVRLSPGQAGLINGWGLFTTLRIYGGRPFAFPQHWARLNRDAVRTEVPVEYQAEFVARALDETIRANHVDSGCARIYLLYNQVGFWRSAEAFPKVDLLIYSTPMPPRRTPVTLGLQAHGRQAAHPLAGVKVTSWLQNAWMLEQAHHRGFEEMILLNERGEVAECTAANLYAVRGGKVETPPLSSGCLQGVTRDTLLALAPGLGISIIERALTPEELYGAEEIFVTSTTREVQPVARIEGHEFSSPGPVTSRLAEAFSAFVEQTLCKLQSVSSSTGSGPSAPPSCG